MDNNSIDTNSTSTIEATQPITFSLKKIPEFTSIQASCTSVFTASKHDEANVTHMTPVIPVISSPSSSPRALNLTALTLNRVLEETMQVTLNPESICRGFKFIDVAGDTMLSCENASEVICVRLNEGIYVVVIF